MFSNQDYTVGPNGVIGAYSIFGEAHGKLAAEIALEILNMEKPNKNFLSRKTDKHARFYFNQKQLDRFGISLPKKIKEQAIFQ